MIRFDDVYKQYAKSDDNALSGISLEVMRGEFVYLVGASGSGKSTFLRLVLREETPSKGKVWVAGTDVGRIRSWKVPALRRKIGVVFQDFRLLPNKTVYQNVAFALQVLGKSGHVIQQTVPATLELVGLQGKAKRMPHELSGGEQQRVAIARACVNRPAILLADEPTGNLDPDTSEGIMALLDRINRTQQTTVVMATHDANIVNTLRRRVLELKQGDLVRDEADGAYLDTVRKLNDGVAGRSPIARIVESGQPSTAASKTEGEAAATQPAVGQETPSEKPTPAGLPAPVPADVPTGRHQATPAAADVLTGPATGENAVSYETDSRRGHFATPQEDPDTKLVRAETLSTADTDTESDEMDYLGGVQRADEARTEGQTDRPRVDAANSATASVDGVVPQNPLTLPVAPDPHGFDGEDFTTTEIVSTSIRPGEGAEPKTVSENVADSGQPVSRHTPSTVIPADDADLMNVPGAEPAERNASDGPPSIVGGAFAAAGLAAADEQLPRPARVDMPGTDTPAASDLLPRPRGPQDDVAADPDSTAEIALNDETHDHTAAGRD